MDKIDEVLIVYYREKSLKNLNSVLYPLYSGMFIFSGAIIVALLNKTSPLLYILLIISAIGIGLFAIYHKAKYEEYNRKHTTLIIKELAANSASGSFEELTEEIAGKTFFEDKDVETVLFRLISAK